MCVSPIADWPMVLIFRSLLPVPPGRKCSVKSSFMTLASWISWDRYPDGIPAFPVTASWWRARETIISDTGVKYADQPEAPSHRTVDILPDID